VHLHRRSQLIQVGHDGGHGGLLSGPTELRDCNGGQKANDYDYDDELNQREASTHAQSPV
jgi:hypothetical protein